MLALQDRQNRRVKYLRLSVTDRCNLRCRYCMPAVVDFLPRPEVLTFEEMVTLTEVFVSLGVSHLRITGGEPLLRRDLPRLIRMLSQVDGVEDLSMTTNAIRLDTHAPALADAGLRRLNVSIDTLDPERFSELTRGGQVERVLAGIRGARDAGLGPIKLNTVIIQGRNERDAGDMIRFARDEGLIPRFIEYMPIGIDGFWTEERFLSVDAVRRDLEEEGFLFEPCLDRPVGGGPAAYWSVTPPGGGTPSPVGFIAALSHNFCRDCNRVRLSCDGRVRECLSDGGRLSLRDLLREGKSTEVIQCALQSALYGKVDGHGYQAEGANGGLRTRVPMSALGG